MSLPNAWCIPSSSGRSEIAFEALACHRDTARIEYFVRLAGKFWYRGGDTDDTDRELLNDFRIELPSVFVPASACDALVCQLRKWANDHEPFTCALASAPDQKLVIEIASREDLLTTADRPAVTIFYEAPSIRVEVFFLVDQSCIDQGTNQLERVLGILSP